MEESPKKSSDSNGVVERGVQEIENEVRSLYLNLQDRIGSKIDARERIVAFVPEYAAYLLNKLHVGEDGKVAYERARGKKPKVCGLWLSSASCFHSECLYFCNYVVDDMGQ